jgi:hypothetical protein
LLPLFQALVDVLVDAENPPEQDDLKRLLLAVLGDLEEVWTDEPLKRALLQLPLCAMVTLMRCDELKVSVCHVCGPICKSGVCMHPGLP